MWYLYLRMLTKGLLLKTTDQLVFFLWLVKPLKKLVNNRIVDQLKKFGYFSEFQYGFRSSRSTADILTSVVSDTIARDFNKSGTTRSVALDISKAFDWVWHACFFHKRKSYGISSQLFGLISSFLSNRRHRVVLDRNSPQEYPVNPGFSQGSILGATLFILYINDLSDDDTCNIIIYADDTTLAKTASNKVEALICSMKFLSLEVTLYLYKSTMRSFMEYCYYVWAGASSSYLELLEKLQKWIGRNFGPLLAACLESLAHHRN